MLVIRFRQQGKINQQSFRLVVADRRSPRDGKYIEKLGWYNPLSKGENNLILDEQKLLYWLDQGAKLSENAEAIIRKVFPDLLKNHTAQKAESKKTRKAKKSEK